MTAPSAPVIGSKMMGQRESTAEMRVMQLLQWHRLQPLQPPAVTAAAAAAAMFAHAVECIGRAGYAGQELSRRSYADKALDLDQTSLKSKKIMGMTFGQ